MFAPAGPADNPLLRELAAELQAYVREAAAQGAPAHEAERAIWQRLLALGRAALGLFFTLQGTGDLGDTVPLPDGQTCQRLPELHDRRYVSIFGPFTLQRTCYGSREGQQIAFVPLDNRLQLPESAFSYVLQDWDQALCVERRHAGRREGSVGGVLGEEATAVEHRLLDGSGFVSHAREPTGSGGT